MTKIVADRYSPKILLQNPTIWVSTDSPGPQQPRFDILSWLWTPRTLRSPRVPGGPFAICWKPLQYGCLRTPLDPSNQDLTFWADSGPRGHWGHQGCLEVLLQFLLETPTICVSTDSPGPQQLQFDILSWLRTTCTLRTPGVRGGHFVYLVPNPYNMGVYGHPLTQAVKICHFELTQDHQDTEGVRRSLC